ncbi:hypothetical protein C6P46_003036 [Rhodotorula mucilaginosa]|uniref:Uncharacterized protein n=1 Tax=Rhodotorula mucilaginosa TaxID=5537 RepID=A0A9P6W3K1_RHOMI|nr:hypothetical protein C6P46_003036 [Rhodotorula mucilaginosa]
MGLLRKLTPRRRSDARTKSSAASSPLSHSTTSSLRSTASPSSSKALDSERPSPATPQRSFPTPPRDPQVVKELDDGVLTPQAVRPASKTRHFASELETSEEEDNSDGYVTASEGEDAFDDVVSLEKASAQAEPKPSPTQMDDSGGAKVPGAAAAAVARRPLGKPMSQLTAADVSLTPEDIKEDIRIIWEALHLFLSSEMIEAEQICLRGSDHRLYFAVGYSLIQAIKSMATFEPDDLEDAIQCCRNTIHIAQLLRKHDYGILARVGSIAKGSASVTSVRTMTVTQRHAELVYSECTLLKAVLSMAYAGDFIAFLKEALNMRAAHATYRTLAHYVEAADAAYGGEDPTIDQDFRSGVNLGNGMISLILSLLPSTVLKIVEVFGFSGDREAALRMLMKPGGWKAGAETPAITEAEQGIRRPIADLVLLMYHLVIANYLPVGGVDIATASVILHYNLDKYPNGIFFLYYAGRLRSTETQLEEATTCFRRAIDAQREYKQLGHICYWDLGLAALAQGDWSHGYEYFNTLQTESNWSKAIYAYSKAVMLYEQDIESETVSALMREVPRLLQKIAGKSIPLEKFVSRRARKFVAQGNRLLLAGLDLAYVLNCFLLAPGFVLHDVHLKQVDETLAELERVADPSEYGQNGDEYWDDFCLAHMLRGVILRVMAHPEPYVKQRPAKPPIPVEEANTEALRSFELVLRHGKDIQHDHHLVWFTHYELGRLYHAQGLWKRAREEYDLVLTGKHLETSTKKGKGKVSLQNMAVLRSNAGLQLLREQGHY